MSSISWRRLVPAAVLLVLCLAVAACTNAKINQANYDKIQPGMSLKEVEGILGGPGTKEEGGDGSNVAGQFGVDVEGMGATRSKPAGPVYVWERGEATITVFFDRHDKVVTKTQRGL